MQTTDPRLIAEYKKMAADGRNLLGLSVLAHREDIRNLIVETKSQTLLDYGSGAGKQYEDKFGLLEEWGVPFPRLYDPAFPALAHKPAGTFDGVLCSDVLEHIPEHLVDAVISELFQYATKFVFASVCCRIAKKKFPDGTNLHCTIQPFEWWLDRFYLHGCNARWSLVETK